MIVGRERERLVVDALLATVADRGAALVLRGEPGVGKTALLDYASAAVASGAASRAVVVRLRGVESETVLPFAVLADLLAPFREQVAELPEAQRAALEVGLAVAEGPAPNPLAVCTGTLNVLAAAAEVVPVVVLVDDLQSVDPPSRQVLLFVARRLSGERVVMLIAVGPDSTELADASGLPSVDVVGLLAAECHELLASRRIELSPEVADTLIRATAGNPLALLETAGSLDAAQLRGEWPIPEPLPVGRQLRRSWSARLAALPERTQQALVLLAASCSSAVDLLAEALAASGLSMADLDPAELSRLVTSTTRAVELRHSLLRSVVLERASLSTRLDAYRLLAQVSTGDLRVWYRAAAAGGPDDEVAAELIEVAFQARRRSGFGTAARAWRRSAELTSDRHQRAERLLQAAIDAHLGGSPHDAATCCEQAFQFTGDPLLRADVALVRGRVLGWTGRLADARDDLLDAARMIGGADAERASALLAEAAAVAVMECRIGAALRDFEECFARSPAEPSWSVSILASYTLIISGRVQDGRHRLQAALRATPIGGNDDYQTLAVLAQCHAWLDDDTAAAQQFDALIESARRDGAPAVLGYALGARSELEFWSGRWAAAYGDAAESLRWARELQQGGVAGFSLACLARIDGVRGDKASCEERVDQFRRAAESSGTGWSALYRSSILGLAALGRGEHDVAVAHLERAWELAVGSGMGISMAVPFTADLVEAQFLAGNRSRAAEISGWLEESAQATGLVWPAAAAARCRGLLASSLPQAKHWFAEANTAHKRRDMPFEQARTLLCHGGVLRRFRRPSDARTPLLAALSSFETLGAKPWAARARAELVAAGGQLATSSDDVSQLDRLAPHELQVARAVADGMDNVEAAAVLFISRKTVEAHLTRIYRKLGVRSRTELARVMAAHGFGENSAHTAGSTAQSTEPAWR